MYHLEIFDLGLLYNIYHFYRCCKTDIRGGEINQKTYTTSCKRLSKMKMGHKNLAK